MSLHHQHKEVDPTGADATRPGISTRSIRYEVMNALRDDVKEPLSLDTRVLRWGGSALVGLAFIFAWREFQFDRTALALTASAIATVISLRRLDGLSRWISPALLLLTGSISTVLWLSLKNPLLLIGVAMPVCGAVWAAIRLRHAVPSTIPSSTAHLPLRLPDATVWHTIGLGLMSVTGGLYFHLLTMQVDTIARRLVLTVVWTLLGIAALFLSRKLSDTAPRDAGFVVLAGALLKATLYDTTHLFGWLRVGLLIAVGALLFFSGSLLPRIRSAERP